MVGREVMVGWGVRKGMVPCGEVDGFGVYFNSLSLPVTEQIADQELSLPIGPVISIDEAKLVVELVNKWRP